MHEWHALHMWSQPRTPSTTDNEGEKHKSSLPRGSAPPQPAPRGRAAMQATLESSEQLATPCPRGWQPGLAACPTPAPKSTQRPPEAGLSVLKGAGRPKGPTWAFWTHSITPCGRPLTPFPGHEWAGRPATGPGPRLRQPLHDWTFYIQRSVPARAGAHPCSGSSVRL